MSHRRTLLTLLGLLVAALVPIGASPASASGTVTVQVTGQGSVTGDGISCNQSGGPDCSESYADTTYQECDPELKPPCHTVTETPVVTLTAGPDGNGFVYDGWTGCDSVAGRGCTMDVTSARSVTVRFRDAQAPQVGLPVPSGGAQRGTVQLAAAPSDNSGVVARMDFLLRGSVIGTDTTVPFQVSFDTTSVSDGPATLEARAYDAAGNVGSNSTSFTIDNSAPQLQVTGPDGATFGPGSTQSWTIAAEDSTSGLDAVQCSVLPTGQAPTYDVCSGGSVAHSVSDLPEGSYELAVRAMDEAGNKTEVSRFFSIDATAPTTTVRSGPASVVRVRGRTATVAFVLRSNEVGSTFRCKLDAKAWKECGARPTFKVALGKHVLKVAATDMVGNRDSTPATWAWTVKKRS